jgi:hypothetical protein
MFGERFRRREKGRGLTLALGSTAITYDRVSGADRRVYADRVSPGSRAVPYDPGSLQTYSAGGWNR